MASICSGLEAAARECTSSRRSSSELCEPQIKGAEPESREFCPPASCLQAVITLRRQAGAQMMLAGVSVSPRIKIKGAICPSPRNSTGFFSGAAVILQSRAVPQQQQPMMYQQPAMQRPVMYQQQVIQQPMTYHQQPVWAGPPPHHQQPIGEDHRRGPSAGPQQQPIWAGPSPPYQQQAMSAEPYVSTPSAPATHAIAALHTQPKGSRPQAQPKGSRPKGRCARTAERFSPERSMRAHSRKVLVRKVDARTAERFSSERSMRAPPKEQNLFGRTHTDCLGARAAATVPVRAQLRWRTATIPVRAWVPATEAQDRRWLQGAA